MRYGVTVLNMTKPNMMVSLDIMLWNETWWYQMAMRRFIA